MGRWHHGQQILSVVPSDIPQALELGQPVVELAWHVYVVSAEPGDQSRAVYAGMHGARDLPNS